MKLDLMLIFHGQIDHNSGADLRVFLWLLFYSFLNIFRIGLNKLDHLVSILSILTFCGTFIMNHGAFKLVKFFIIQLHAYVT